jgi:hypothetical protein
MKPAESGERLSVIDCLVPLLFGFRITSAVNFEGDAVRIAVRYTQLDTVSGLEVALPEKCRRQACAKSTSTVTPFFDVIGDSLISEWPTIRTERLTAH